MFPAWGRSRGRAAVFGESAFLRAASDIGGPLRGPLPVSLRSSGSPVRFSSSRSYQPEERRKKGWLPESASGRQKDRVLCARVCICVRSFRCPYVGLVMRERMRSPSRQGGGHSMKRFIDYRPGPRHCFIARAVVLLARRRLEMSIMPGV